MIFTYFKFFEFESGLRETERSQNRGIDRCYSSISWQGNDGSTFGHSFQDSMTYQSRAIPFQSRKIVKFEKIMALIFLNCESKFDSTDVPSWIYDRKTAARPFDTIHDILRCLSLAQSLLKGRNAPIWRKRAPTHMTLSGTDGLTRTLGWWRFDDIFLNAAAAFCIFSSI